MSLVPQRGVLIEPTVKQARVAIFFGPTKVGKTSAAIQLKDHLIIDTEGGSAMYKCRRIGVENLADIQTVYKELKNQPKEKYIVLDTIDNLVSWIVTSVCERNGMETLQDFSFGKGYSLVRERTMKVIKLLESCCETLIIIGHRKRSLIGDTSVEMDINTLDLPGAGLRNELVAYADTIGFMFRDPESDKLMVSFEPKESGVEAGSRFNKGVIEFNWNTIFKNEESKQPKLGATK